MASRNRQACGRIHRNHISGGFQGLYAFGLWSNLDFNGKSPAGCPDCDKRHHRYAAYSFPGDIRFGFRRSARGKRYADKPHKYASERHPFHSGAGQFHSRYRHLLRYGHRRPVSVHHSYRQPVQGTLQGQRL